MSYSLQSKLHKQTTLKRLLPQKSLSTMKENCLFSSPSHLHELSDHAGRQHSPELLVSSIFASAKRIGLAGFRKKCKPTELCKVSESKYSGLLCYENCVRLQARWLLNDISNVWYESDFFQDSLEELKLAVRGSLFQVASLQDCFLQQSEPLAATSTGVGSWAVCTPPSTQTPRPPAGLGPIPERWAVGRAALQDHVPTEMRLLPHVQGKECVHCTFISIIHRNLE